MKGCIPFFHDWTKWSEIRVTNDGEAVQAKVCNRCGKVALWWPA